VTRRDLTFITIYLALHGAFVALLVTLPLDLPDDFEFALPVEVEFGIVEEMEGEDEPAVAEPEPEPEPAPKRRPKRPAPDPSATASADDDAAEEDAPVEPPKPKADPASRIPAGSQIALRIDMSRVRDSRLSTAARKLIRQIPDWHLLAGGSGIDPVDGLDRLLIATPDPRRRDLIVLAGKSVGDESSIRLAAETIAESQGQAIEFRDQQGIPVAPWHSIDPTARVIALVGPQHFTISQPSVLGTILAMTRHRERSARAEGLERARGADALLSLGEDDAISIEVENVASYARRLPCAVPEKGRASIRETESGVSIDAAVFHASPEDAAEAATCWDRLRRVYANHLFVRLLGLGPALDRAEVAQADASVRVSVSLSDAQARQLLGMVGAQIARLTGYRPPPEPVAVRDLDSVDTPASPAEAEAP
jgi:hypothetical protein